MKKKHLFVFLSCFLFLLASSAAYPSGISLGFRLYGALHSMSGGDLNSGMSGRSKFLEIQADLAGMSVDGAYQDIRWGLVGGGDLLVHFANWVGLEVGGGYCQASKESVVRYDGPPDTGRWTIKPSASAVPVRAGLFFLLPLTSGLSLSAHGGAMYLMATAETSFRLESDVTGMWMQETQKATASGIGYYGGLGLEIRIAPGFFFLVEAQGRLARLDGFEGNLIVTNSLGGSDGRSGTLYHFQVDLPPGLSASSVNLIEIFEEAPTGSGWLDVRPARVDFDGFGAAFGFIIRL